MNYRPWGYEPHGLTWLPHPAPLRLPPHTLINLPSTQTTEKMPRPDPRRIAQQRIEILYNKAKETYGTDPALSRRYIQLLRRIAQRTRTKLPTHVRRGICRGCGNILIPGLNSHTRLRQRREPHAATTCHLCGRIHRIPLRPRRPT